MHLKPKLVVVIFAMFGALLFLALGAHAQTGDRPETPFFTGTNPPSESNNNHPRFYGVAQPGTVVTLHDTPDCTGEHLGIGTPEEFANPGIVVEVPDNSTTTLWVHVNEGGLAGRQSHCSAASITYVEKTPRVAAIKKCNRKHPKGSKKRKRCIKKAKNVPA